MTNSHIANILGGREEPTDRGRQLFEDAPFAYHEIDIHGVIREVNRAECQLLGYQPAEMLGHRIWEFAAAEQAENIQAAITRKVAREQPLTTLTREYRRSDGTYIWLEIRERLIENALGEVVGIRSALVDITERHNLDSKIHRQNQRMKCILQSLTRSIVSADALGNVDFMNSSAESLTGWRLQEAEGQPLEAVCRVRHESGERVDLMSCILAEPVISNKNRKFEIVDRSGVCHGVSWIVTPVRNADGVIIGAALVLEKG